MNEIRIDVNLIIEELKAQRNTLADQLAMAGAHIIYQKKEIESLQKAIVEATKKIPQE